MHVSASRGNSAGIVVVALTAVLVCAAAAVAVVVITSGGSTPGRRPTPQVPVKMGGAADVFPLPGPPASLALGHGSLWIPTDGQVLRIDPKTARIVARISVPAVGESSVVATTPSAVWVAPASNHAVVRIDPTTDRVVKTVRVGFYPVALRVTQHHLQVISGTGVRYADRRLARAVAKVGGYDGVLARGRAWAVTWGRDRRHPNPGTVSMLDPVTGRLLQTRTVGGTPTAVAVGYGAVWVTNFADSTLTRIPLAHGS